VIFDLSQPVNYRQLSRLKPFIIHIGATLTTLLLLEHIAASENRGQTTPYDKNPVNYLCECSERTRRIDGSRCILFTLRHPESHIQLNEYTKGAITSKIKHAIKLKTSPAKLAQLLQPSLAFCFSLQPMTAYRPDGVPSSPGRYAVIGCKLKQNANDRGLQQLYKSCRTCFIACFILLVIAP